MKDIQNRAYATVSDVKAGDTVWTDGDVTCLMPWAQYTVLEDQNGLHMSCLAIGPHYLDAYIEEGHYVGLYNCDPGEMGMGK